MKKRTVWFGIPVYALRMFRPLVLVGVLAVCLYWVFVELVGAEVIPIDWLLKPWFSVGVMVLPFVVLVGWNWVIAMRVGAFQKRLKELGGRVCFRCGYEIGEGIEVCSECGAAWRVEELNRGWRRHLAKPD